MTESLLTETETQGAQDVKRFVRRLRRDLKMASDEKMNDEIGISLEECKLKVMF